MNNRILFSNDGAIEDFSVALNNYQTGTKAFPYVEGEDYLFIGSRLPFNHIYFKLSNPNVVSANMSVEYWDGTRWIETVEVIDETQGFTQSGFVQFTPDRTYGWGMDSTNYRGETVEGLETVNIYDLYWVRISFDASLEDVDSEAPIISWCGNLFSDDLDLGVEYPDLVRPETISSFKTGKIDWQEQHVRAAQVMIQDLINRRLICGPGQILDWREFTNVAIHKTAEIIFNAFGDDYTDNTVTARKEYNERISKRLARIDLNGDATETDGDRYNPAGYFTR